MNRAVDDHGLAAAMNMALHTFEQSSRRSGRTARLLASVRDNDVIVTWGEPERARLKRQLRELGKPEVEVVVLDPKKDPLYRQGTNPSGATIFDHGWIFQHYQHRLTQIASDIDIWQAAMSKEPPPPYEPSEMRYRYDRWIP